MPPDEVIGMRRPKRGGESEPGDQFASRNRSTLSRVVRTPATRSAMGRSSVAARWCAIAIERRILEGVRWRFDRA